MRVPARRQDGRSIPSDAESDEAALSCPHPVEEGIDLAIRIGELEDSSLAARKLAPNRRVVCASPAYLRQHGEPRTPEEMVATYVQCLRVVNHPKITFSTAMLVIAPEPPRIMNPAPVSTYAPLVLPFSDS